MTSGHDLNTLLIDHEMSGPVIVSRRFGNLQITLYSIWHWVGEKQQTYVQPDENLIGQFALFHPGHIYYW